MSSYLPCANGPEQSAKAATIIEVFLYLQYLCLFAAHILLVPLNPIIVLLIATIILCVFGYFMLVQDDDYPTTLSMIKFELIVLSTFYVFMSAFLSYLIWTRRAEEFGAAPQLLSGVFLCCFLLGVHVWFLRIMKYSQEREVSQCSDVSLSCECCIVLKSQKCTPSRKKQKNTPKCSEYVGDAFPQDC